RLLVPLVARQARERERKASAGGARQPLQIAREALARFVGRELAQLLHQAHLLEVRRPSVDELRSERLPPVVCHMLTPRQTIARAEARLPVGFEKSNQVRPGVMAPLKATGSIPHPPGYSVNTPFSRC